MLWVLNSPRVVHFPRSPFSGRTMPHLVVKWSTENLDHSTIESICLEELHRWGTRLGEPTKLGDWSQTPLDRERHPLLQVSIQQQQGGPALELLESCGLMRSSWIADSWRRETERRGPRPAPPWVPTFPPYPFRCLGFPLGKKPARV